MILLAKQHEFFESNKHKLLLQYKDKVIVISDQLEITSFDDKMSALLYGSSTYGLGHFMLQVCTEEEVNAVHYISSHWS